MSIKQWPEMERPREKLLHKGADVLSDAELLAIFLRSGIKGKTAIDIARDLLIKFGSLQRLLNSSFEQFSQISGLGLAKYTQMKASIELAKRYLLNQDEPKPTYLESTRAARDYLQLHMSHYTQEVFAVILLNNQNTILAFDELFFGSAHQAPVFITPLVKHCLDKNASSIILVHNHPSGNAKPSQADIDITKQISYALTLFEIRVLDHFIVTANKVESLAELGYLGLT